MDKQQLIEYLNAVCDAESAVQACEDAAMALRRSFQLHAPDAPQEPVRKRSNSNFFASLSDDSMGCLGLAVVGAIIDIASSVVVYNLTESGWWTAAWACLGAPYAMAMLMTLLDTIIRSAHQSKLDSEYEAAMDGHRSAMQVHELRMAAYYDTVQQLEQMVQQQMRRKADAQNLLNRLYSLNVLDPSCRNIIAVYQIRQYLRMGVCDALEGPTGAYAQYMNDVRTARICTSIADLKRSITSAISHMQSALAMEIQQVGHNMEALQADMNQGIRGLQSAFYNTSTQLNTHLMQTNQHLASMRDNTAIMAHNQYVEQRIRNVDAYLLRWPAA